MKPWTDRVERNDNGCLVWTGHIDRHGYGRWTNPTKVALQAEAHVLIERMIAVTA